MKTFKNNDPSTFDMMAEREYEVMELMVQHGDIAKVAELLGLSPKTVSHLIGRVKMCMDIDNTILAVLTYDRWKRSGNEWKASEFKR